MRSWLGVLWQQQAKLTRYRTDGAVIGELTAQRDPLAAGRAGVGATLGLVIGAVAKLAVAVSMAGIFVLVRFLGGN